MFLVEIRGLEQPWVGALIRPEFRPSTSASTRNLTGWHAGQQQSISQSPYIKLLLGGSHYGGLDPSLTLEARLNCSQRSGLDLSAVRPVMQGFHCRRSHSHGIMGQRFHFTWLDDVWEDGCLNSYTPGNNQFNRFVCVLIKKKRVMNLISELGIYFYYFGEV